MKGIVKNFGQFVNENEYDNGREMGAGAGVSLVELLDCYVRENYANDRVLVLVNISNSASDLVEGGITFTVNPTERELGEAQYDGTMYAELYDNGDRIGEEELDSKWDN